MEGKEHMIRNEIAVLRRISIGHANILTLVDYFETLNNCKSIGQDNLFLFGAIVAVVVLWTACIVFPFSHESGAPAPLFFCPLLVHFHKKNVVFFCYRHSSI